MPKLWAYSRQFLTIGDNTMKKTILSKHYEGTYNDFGRKINLDIYVDNDIFVMELYHQNFIDSSIRGIIYKDTLEIPSVIDFDFITKVHVAVKHIQKYVATNKINCFLEKETNRILSKDIKLSHPDILKFISQVLLNDNK